MGICLAVLFGSLTPAQTVDAAAKTVKLTVCYKGKNVTFQTIRNPCSPKRTETIKVKTYAAVKKVWGKANKVEKVDYGTNYTWKKGKTTISFYTRKNGKRMGNIRVAIQNKSASLWGVKVGMSKKQALQKLRKQFGKKNVSVENNRIFIKILNPNSIALKNGKVKSIDFFIS